jgi:enoyl-CoA hydratase/carnithine racemase
VCGAGAALETAISIAERLGRNPPTAMALLKAALTTGNTTLETAIETEINFASVLMNSDDYAAAVQAFQQRRRPAAGSTSESPSKETSPVTSARRK